MRYIINRLPLVCFLLLAVCLLAPAPLSAQTFSGKCVGVTDGDTIKVLRDGRETKIRLEGIDCPETGELVRVCGHLSRYPECFGLWRRSQFTSCT